MEKTMPILKHLGKVLVISILLYSVVITLRHPHKEYYDATGAFVYSKGNAPDSTRAEIAQQLREFQDGYTHRDTSQVQPFMHDLFSQEDILVLGTMPHEILVGQDRVARLILSDWKAWGDCTFLMNSAHISTSGNVAWISTIGYVKFDMCRFLVLPLRLSAVMVKEDLSWKFQYLQFQFDVDLTFLLLTMTLLAIWLAVSLVSFAAMILRRLQTANT
jgi:hypothetical protein